MGACFAMTFFGTVKGTKVETEADWRTIDV